jgi:hypothetical protein
MAIKGRTSRPDSGVDYLAAVAYTLAGIEQVNVYAQSAVCSTADDLIPLWKSMIYYHNTYLHKLFRGRRLRCIHPNITSRLPRISTPINVLFSYYALAYHSCEPDSTGICFDGQSEQVTLCTFFSI